jgi:hypothetical protein
MVHLNRTGFGGFLNRKSGSRIKLNLLETLRSKATRRRQELLTVANELPADGMDILTRNIEQNGDDPVYDDATLGSAESAPEAELRKPLSPPDATVRPKASGRRRASSIVNRSNLPVAILASEILRPPLSMRQGHQ